MEVYAQETVGEGTETPVSFCAEYCDLTYWEGGVLVMIALVIGFFVGRRFH